MATQQPNPQQGGSSGQSQQQGGSAPQQPGQVAGQPIFRDWAAI